MWLLLHKNVSLTLWQFLWITSCISTLFSISSWPKTTCNSHLIWSFIWPLLSSQSVCLLAANLPSSIMEMKCYSTWFTFSREIMDTNTTETMETQIGYSNIWIDWVDKLQFVYISLLFTWQYHKMGSLPWSQPLSWSTTILSKAQRNCLSLLTYRRRWRAISILDLCFPFPLLSCSSQYTTESQLYSKPSMTRSTVA